jgi:tRNA modification GTPase
MGVERTRDQMKKASLILYLFDLSNGAADDIRAELQELDDLGIPYLKIGNKMDQAGAKRLKQLEQDGFVLISASQKTNIQELKDTILSRFQVENVKQGDVLVTNLRHYHQLVQTNSALDRVLLGMDREVTGDFLAMDIRQALHFLGEITGEITTDDLLANIFSKFCIGK